MPDQKIDFKKTFDNAKRNITKAYLANITARRWQTIQNYYTGATKIPRKVNKVFIKTFKVNDDEVFYI